MLSSSVELELEELLDRPELDDDSLIVTELRLLDELEVRSTSVLLELDDELDELEELLLTLDELLDVDRDWLLVLSSSVELDDAELSLDEDEDASDEPRMTTPSSAVFAAAWRSVVVYAPASVKPVLDADDVPGLASVIVPLFRTIPEPTVNAPTSSDASTVYRNNNSWVPLPDT